MSSVAESTSICNVLCGFAGAPTFTLFHLCLTIKIVSFGSNIFTFHFPSFRHQFRFRINFSLQNVVLAPTNGHSPSTHERIEYLNTKKRCTDARLFPADGDGLVDGDA